MKKEKELRLRVSEDLHKKYRMFCLENNLSMPKQTALIIKSFLDMQEDNKSRTYMRKV